MKTTIELPDDLLIEAKVRAAELRRSLRSIIESALRAELQALATGRREPEERPEIRWVTADGGLPMTNEAPLDVADRAALAEWMRRERSGER